MEVVVGQLQIWIWHQIHIWVVPFDLNLGSSHALVPSMSHPRWIWGMSTLDPDPAPDPYLGCTFWPEFRVHSGSDSSAIYVSPYLGCTFWPEFYCIGIMSTLLSLKFNIWSHSTMLQVVRFEKKFLHKQWLWFPDEHFGTTTLVILDSILLPYFCLSQYYLLYVYISHIFYFWSLIW